MFPLRSAAVIAIAALLTGFIGAQLGQPLGYALSEAVGRDIAEIKTTLIWCIVLTPIATAAAGAYGAASATGRCRPLFGWTFTVISALAVLIVYASYEPIKTFGTPIIDFELRLPEGMTVNGIGSIDLTIWNEKNGQGCYISRIDNGRRQIISGSIVLQPDNYTPSMSLAFHDGDKWTKGGGWVLPYKPGASIEQNFRPWETVAFDRALRDLPALTGRFEIRYRLRHFI